jgi:hypothetical protein
MLDGRTLQDFARHWLLRPTTPSTRAAGVLRPAFATPITGDEFGLACSLEFVCAAPA